MVNQIQLLILLVLTKSSLPDRIVEFLTDNLFAAFSFDFLSSQDFSILNKPIEWMNEGQSNEHLSNIGLEYFH